MPATGRFIQNNEAARLNALRDLRLLDTPPSESFDRLTRMASRLLRAPVSTISLTDADRQWFKSKVGVHVDEIPREQAPCAYAIEGSEVFVVSDLLEDDRFKTSPLAQAGIRCYAGAPLVTRSGHGLGTICVVDDTPRDFDDEERRTLRDLADMVMALVEVQNVVGRFDATTGFPNQHQFLEDLERGAAQHPGRRSAAIVVEVLCATETARAVRVLGMTHVDLLVGEVLRSLRSEFANTANVYHVGPMRCAVFESCEGGGASVLAKAVLRVLASPVACGGVPVTLIPAVGCHDFFAGDAEPEDVMRCLLGAADDCRASGGGIAFHSASKDQDQARGFTLVNAFASALTAEGQLRLVYQPRIVLPSGRPMSLEALLRWDHPTLGTISPGEFVPLVEQTALVQPMTEWVIVNAARQALDWRRSGLCAQVSVNVSARNLDETDFAVRLLSTLRKVGLTPDALELEFTESAAARDALSVSEQLRTLHEAGVAIAIDDFGTGYSNLANIQKLPFSVLKIDRSFITDLTKSDTDRKLVRSMTVMGRDLGFRIVAEGVETQEVQDLLAQFGCDEIQGYYVARPMPADVAGEWLRERLATGGWRVSA